MMIRLELLAEDYVEVEINGHKFKPANIGSMHPVVKAFERLGIIKDEFVPTVCLHSRQLVLIRKDYTATVIPLPGMLFNGCSGTHIFHIGETYARIAFKSTDSCHGGVPEINQGVQSGK